MSTNNFLPIPSQKEKELAALSYLWIFSLLIYFSPKGKSQFVQFHAKQGIVLFLLSIIIYFLPHFLFWLNFFTLLAITLGVIESALGNWYPLPIIGEIIQGNFHPQKYADFLKGLLLKTKKYWPKSSSVFKNAVTPETVFKNTVKPANPYLFKNAPVGEIAPQKLKISFKLDTRNKWLKNITEFEQTCQSLLKNKGLIINNSPEGFLALKQDKEYFYFGKVVKNNFAIAYCNEQDIFPGDETIGNWEVKHYDINHFNLESFKALLNLITD